MSHVNLDSKRLPVLKLDNQYCLLTLEPADLQSLPEGLHCYDIRASDKNPATISVHQHAPAADRLGHLFSKEPLPLDHSNAYYPDRVSALAMGTPPTAKEFLRLSNAELAQEQDIGFLYLSSFGPVPLYIAPYTYHDGNLYLGADFFDEEEQIMDCFSSITVNIARLPYLHSTIDTNDNGEKIIDFLTHNGFGTCTDHFLYSGFCGYPVFQFTEEAIHRLNPTFLEAYAAQYGRKPAINQETDLSCKIRSAEERCQTPQSKSTKQPHQLE